MERRGERPEKLVGVSKKLLFKSAETIGHSSSVGAVQGCGRLLKETCFWGGNMKNHESNRGKVGSQLVKNSAGTHRDVSRRFP